MIRLKSIRVAINDTRELNVIIANKLKVNEKEIKSYKIHKKSIDARNKSLFSYVYDFDVDINNEDKYLKLKYVETVNDPVYELPTKGSVKLKNRPVVVGFGPAGMFAALYLAKMGYKPIVFERGDTVENRVTKISNFWQDGLLDEETNVQFGEGGAGTFSDGKLNTLVKDKFGRMPEVFKTFVECGAPKEIMYDYKPHIGTDNLRDIVKNIRNKIIELGGNIYYNSLVDEIVIDGNQVKGVKVNDKYYESEIVVLAIGHSARDTYRYLFDLGVSITSKPMAIGVRIIHKQDFINNLMYPVNFPNLPSASYKLTYNTKDKRGIYSFCMCPGGYVVNASSNNGYLVINGMSNYKRDSGYANSAIVVTINENDFGHKPLDGLNYLESIERTAWKMGNGKIIVQKYGDYKNNKDSSINEINGLKGNYISGNINNIFSNNINNYLKEGIDYFGTRLPGYNNRDVIICAPETRTSSPIRILRDESLESNIKGLYPCGEGSGYAGGITTSAIDGLKVFESIVKKYYL